MEVYKYYYRVLIHNTIATRPGDTSGKVYAGVFSLDVPITDNEHIMFMLQQLGKQFNADPTSLDLTTLTFLGAFQLDQPAAANQEKMDA